MKIIGLMDSPWRLFFLSKTKISPALFHLDTSTLPIFSVKHKLVLGWGLPGITKEELFQGVVYIQHKSSNRAEFQSQTLQIQYCDAAFSIVRKETTLGDNALC